ncbi:MAG: FtsX-like permease family protein [Clostridiales bacterium]|nr:FtsX-like permease family protein [Clostridiales bacterium]
MDTLILLRANMLRRKGTFVGIVLLMIIISMSMTAIMSVKTNVRESVDEAYEEADVADVFMDIPTKILPEDLLEKVRNHPMVDHVEVLEAVAITQTAFKDGQYANNWQVLPLDRHVVRMYNEDLSCYVDSIPEPSPDGFYVPLGIQTEFGCELGDTFTVKNSGCQWDLTVEGYIVEPICGASTIGSKTVYVARETFDKMLAESKEAEKNIENHLSVTMVMIYKADSCTLSDNKLARKLSQDTGLESYAYNASTRSQMKNYTVIYSDIVLSVMLAFISLLLGIVLIIMKHTISVSIDMNYTELGIMKAMGFTVKKIRILLSLQYVIAEAFGALVGTILSFPLIRALGNVFQPITGIKAKTNIVFFPSFPILILLLLMSCVFVFLVTRKAGQVSPVKAITGERGDVYFDKALTAPISGNALSLSLSFRQFTSSKRKYIAVTLIAAMLMFFMLTVNQMVNVMNSKSAMNAMGNMLAEVRVTDREDGISEEKVQEMQKIVESVAEIDAVYSTISQYISFDNVTMLSIVARDPNSFVISKGRAPLYDNEIAITDIIAEEFDLCIGDSVHIERRGMSGDYVISGIFLYISDVGHVTAMSYDAAKKLGTKEPYTVEFSLKDPKKSEAVYDALVAEYGDSMLIRYSETCWVDDTFTIAINAMQIMIYSFSIAFALVVVFMVCTKLFAQERRDIGIYKAVGFTSRKLRLLFAFRFMIVALFGSIIGTVLSFLFSNRLLEMLLRSMGVTTLTASHTFSSTLIPILLLLLSFFCFAFLASRKVKKVEVRELVIE